MQDVTINETSETYKAPGATENCSGTDRAERAKRKKWEVALRQYHVYGLIFSFLKEIPVSEK